MQYVFKYNGKFVGSFYNTFKILPHCELHTINSGFLARPAEISFGWFWWVITVEFYRDK